MNKRTLFLAASSLFLVGSLASCAKSEVSPVAMEFGRKYDADLPLWDSDTTSTTYKVGNVKDIGYADLTTLITNRQISFVLLIADVNSTCGCFSFFKSSIISYLKSSNAFLYSINPSEFNGDGKSFYNLKVSTNEGNETVAIFKNGTLYDQRQRSGQEDTWSNDATTFAAWMNARVKVPNMLYIDIKQLEKLTTVGSADFNGLDHFVIGYFRDRCTDCRYLSDHFLTTYNATEHGESYVIDCDVPGLHDPTDGTTAATSASAAQWAAFKVKYGLAKSGNAAFGFDTGYVPSFQYWQNGSIADMEVYVNDSLTPNSDGTCALSETYWDGTREHAFFESLSSSVVTNLLGVSSLKNIPASDFESGTYSGQTYYSWNHDKAALYHDPLIQGFLDYYVSK